MTKSKFPGISIIRGRGKLGLRLRREKEFDRSFIVKELLWDKPEDHEKLEEIIDEAIVETEWLPYDGNSMKRLFDNLYEKYGKFSHIHNKYQHIKSLKPCDTFDRLLIKKEKPKNNKLITSKEDPILTELRLIRNYLEKLTLLQEANHE
jgi:hypothetical protein